MKVLYVGDCSTRMEFEIKGAEVLASVDRFVDASGFLRRALNTDSNIEVKHMCPHIAYGDFPETLEELEGYDVLILSDVGYETIVLYPTIQRKLKVPMGPNRVKNIKAFVENGGGLLYCGGYFAFQGRFGRARWWGTPVAEVLPVEILPIHSDTWETPEGVKPKILNPDHELLKGIPTDWPIFMGYNKVGDVKKGANLLATIEDNPFIAEWTYKKGRVFVFTSDPAPHWGGAFYNWDPHYTTFWVRVINWLARSK